MRERATRAQRLVAPAERDQRAAEVGAFARGLPPTQGRHSAPRGGGTATVAIPESPILENGKSFPIGLGEAEGDAGEEEKHGVGAGARAWGSPPGLGGGRGLCGLDELMLKCVCAT